jgi:hypothetical protein
LLHLSEGSAFHGLPINKDRLDQQYAHDHDEELGMYWYGNPARALLERPPRKVADVQFWLETGNLVREYLILQAGAVYSDALEQGFVTWLQNLPERRQYVGGDDMRRAALVDWYLKVAR